MIPWCLHTAAIAHFHAYNQSPCLPQVDVLRQRLSKASSDHAAYLAELAEAEEQNQALQHQLGSLHQSSDQSSFALNELQQRLQDSESRVLEMEELTASVQEERIIAEQKLWAAEEKVRMLPFLSARLYQSIAEFTA